MSSSPPKKHHWADGQGPSAAFTRELRSIEHGGVDRVHAVFVVTRAVDRHGDAARSHSELRAPELVDRPEIGSVELFIGLPGARLAGQTRVAQRVELREGDEPVPIAIDAEPDVRMSGTLELPSLISVGSACQALST